ncbi:PadR family transcriptional regulator [Nonomuraea sp. NPDC050310]|uniref:PadR family transcriptional regulator n=1 Tax=Nonomuraea sp. NPDC050310 TaxID=3154935 RepID=UPI00340F5B49
MPKPRKPANLLALAVLSYLSWRPMHPYELSRTLRDHGDDRSIKFTHGSLYMVVGQLLKAGLIAEVETSRQGQLPERTVYSLTEAGRLELRDWLRELVEQPRHEYPGFVAALSLIGALPPDEAVALLRGRLERLAERRKETVALIDGTLSSGLPELFVIEEEYRLAVLDAEIAFVERFVRRIVEPGTGWHDAWARAHGRFATGGGPPG